MATTVPSEGKTEITILARLLGGERGRLPEDLARYILDLGFSEHDQARMHDLAARNQEDGLSVSEKEELLAFGRAGDLLAILKSKARRSLGMKPGKGDNSTP
jgi:hypothetical protein